MTPSPALTISYAALGMGLPTALVYKLWRGPMELSRKVFGASICIFVLGLSSFLVVGSYSVYIGVTPNHLKIEAPPAFTSKTFTRVDVVRAFLIDLSRDEGYHPTNRAIALGWGEYRVGWYILNSGEKALIITEDRGQRPIVLCLEMVEGYYIMISPSRFDEFLQVFNSTFTTVEI